MYSSDMAVQRLLLINNYKAHMTDESKRIVNENCNSELIFIPAGCTPLVQHMDVSVNRQFKQCIRDLWVLWFATHTQCTFHGNPKTPSPQEVIKWTSAAWDSIKLTYGSPYSVASQLTWTVGAGQRERNGISDILRYLNVFWSAWEMVDT